MKCRAALTLLELLVVISIIGMLVAILLPAIQYARESSRRTACRNNLRQVALGVVSFNAAHKHFPAGRFNVPDYVGPDSAAWSWMARTLPYLEEQPLFSRGRVGQSTLRESGILDQQVPIFLCPNDEYSRTPRTDAGDLDGLLVGQTNYQAVSGANWGADESQKKTDIGTDWPNPGTNGSWDGLNSGDGIMRRADYLNPRTVRHVKDGISKTFMVGECLPEKNCYTGWAYSNNAHATCAIPPNVTPREGSDYSPNWWPNVGGFRSYHPGGLHFAHADASVDFIADEIELGIYRAGATISGND